MINLYLNNYFKLSFITLFSVWIFNYIIDPLWYDEGNRITGKNFAFNERVSKTNLFLQDKEQYDCLILGNSRVTLLKSFFI